MEASTFTFPADSVDTRQKNKAWILQYVKAAFYASKGYFTSSLWFGNIAMNEKRLYGMGKQSIEKYKKTRLAEDQTETYEYINWSPIDLLSKYRNIVVSLICQRLYNVECSAVDPISKSEQDAKFNELKAKILMADMARKMGSELADNPALKPAPNEPQDMEQLLMEKEYGYKHVLAMEAELGIQLVQQENNFEELRKRVIEDLVDFGMGAYSNCIDENGKVITKHIDPRQLVLSPMLKRDGSDLTYWGVMEEVYLGEIAKFFNPEDLKRIGEISKGQWGNPREFNYGNANWYHHCKVMVFDCKFKSYNTTAYEERTDDSGNRRFGRIQYNKRPKPLIFENTDEEELVDEDGWAINENGLLHGVSDADNSKPIYSANTIEVVYKGKWIYNSEFIYDYGLSENMVRKPSTRSYTSLDLQLYSWNFDRGIFGGLTEKLMPLEDEACLLWYKMQNLAAKLIPYLVEIDMTQLEGISYGKGGALNTPDAVLEFVLSNYMVLKRTGNLLDINQNMQPNGAVSVNPTGQMYAIVELSNQMLRIEQMIKSVSGLNDLTDGSTPGERTLTTPANAAIQSTNNAIYPILFADRQLIVANAENAVGKLQIAVILGKVEGYARIMGEETVRFLQISPEIALREFGIFAEVMPTNEERQMLFQDVTLKESQGLLDITDKVMVMSAKNMKQAMMILGYRIKKRKEEQQQFELQKIQQNNEGQTQSALTIEAAKQETIKLQTQMNIQQIIVEKQYDMEIEKMKKTFDLQGEITQTDGRTLANQIQHDAKIKSAAVTGEYQLEKQAIANKKPKPKTSTAK